MAGQRSHAGREKDMRRGFAPALDEPGHQPLDPEALQQAALERVVAEIYASALCEQGFVRQVSSGLHALLEVLAHDPDLAHLAMLEVGQQGPPRYMPNRRALEKLTSLFEDLTERAPIETPAPPSTATTVASGVLATIAREIEQGRTTELLRLHPELLFLALVPYVGTEVAAAEMDRSRR